ncbi:MAG TPA: phosphotransferase [Chloroflexota bacterium]|jgi:aminoglycoside phosphotransferase (APT) family kinase protein|nr:phosphotransferase [Chloroflexota bacterium]
MDTLDPIAILQTLGITDVVKITSVTGGWDTTLWRIERPGSIYALRVFPTGRERNAEREAAVMRSALAAGVPVPKIDAEGIWNGHAALLLTWCAGHTLAQAALNHPWELLALGVAFGRAQAKLNAVPAPAILWSDPERWITRAGPDEMALAARLRAETDRPDRLLHLDYHPLNVLVEGPRVTGILDWANALAGDPRADFARTTTILRLVGAGPPGPRRPFLTLALRLVEWAWRHGYQQSTGPLADLAPFYAWAGAVMLRDLSPRVGRPGIWLDGQDLDRMHKWTDFWKRKAGIK